MEATLDSLTSTDSSPKALMQQLLLCNQEFKAYVWVTQSRPGYPLTGSHRDRNLVISKEPEASSSESCRMECEQGRHSGMIEDQ